MRTAALILLVALLALGGAGCSKQGAPAESPAQTSSALTPTSNQRSAITSEKRQFIESMHAAGFNFTSGDESMVQVGEYICGDIRMGTPPAQTQAELKTKNLTDEQAAKVYELAQMIICPYSVPLTTVSTAAQQPTMEVIAYEVTGNGVRTAGTITYIKDNNFSQEQVNSVRLPWTKKIEFDAYRSFDALSIVAQSGSGGNGSITCRILRDGTELTSSTSSGPYAVVTCSIS